MSRARDIIEAETPRDVLRQISGPSMPEEFLEYYVETALWSSTDDEGDPLDRNYGPDNIDEPTKAKMLADCQAFWRENWKDIEDNPAHAGHDFWLTRNGHGAGFWDGDWDDEEHPDRGDRLSDAAKRFDEVYLMVGDDGQIYA